MLLQLVLLMMMMMLAVVVKRHGQALAYGMTGDIQVSYSKAHCICGWVDRAKGCIYGTQ
jgi:hypothetical protein